MRPIPLSRGGRRCRAAVLSLLAAAAWAGSAPLAARSLDLPWREMGWSEREAAAHLLDRLSFGPRPGDVDAVVELGLADWVEAQLDGVAPGAEVEARLHGLRTLELGTLELADTYPNPGLVLMEAREAGVLPEGVDFEGLGEEDRALLREKVIAFARQRGYRSQRELLGETMIQKLVRAVYSENQLTEVLVDFWFNHFNVSLTDTQTRSWLLSYERDAIRPHVLGRFRRMLEATARHPAMLLYLDNAQSGAEEGATTTLDQGLTDLRRRFGGRGRFGAPGRGRMAGPRPGPERPNRPRGLNENYARELLELHTLGVDGGYSQQDVIEVARAFTGWAVFPPEILRRRVGDRLDRALAWGVGFSADPEAGFLFRADAHDAGPKVVLGHRLAAGRGLEDGLEVLDLLAAHPSTARHLARKLAERFVSDRPPESLVERLAARYEQSGGDLTAVMEALVTSMEFWDRSAREAKIKSPFELAVSAVRALDADIREPRALVEWIGRMGEPLYAYQAPTGYPDRADFWVNTGALLNRMNFALQLATGRLEGVAVDLLALNGGREPEALDRALETYAALLLPERELGETVARLEPMVRDPELLRRLGERAPESGAPDLFGRDGMDLLGGDWRRPPGRYGTARPYGPPSPLGQVVGVILGSPEFQRR